MKKITKMDIDALERRYPELSIQTRASLKGGANPEGEGACLFETVAYHVGVTFDELFADCINYAWNSGERPDSDRNTDGTLDQADLALQYAEVGVARGDDMWNYLTGYWLNGLKEYPVDTGGESTEPGMLTVAIYGPNGEGPLDYHSLAITGAQGTVEEGNRMFYIMNFHDDFDFPSTVGTNVGDGGAIYKNGKVVGNFVITDIDGFNGW